MNVRATKHDPASVIDFETIRTAIAWIVVGGAALLSLVLAVISLQWRYVHDLPTMLYVGWMIDRGAVVYRDICDVNMPGTYALMWAIGKIAGWTDVGVRIVDLAGLGILSWLSFLWLKPFGKQAQVGGIALFPIYYLAFGHLPMTLEREALVLVPLMAVIVLAEGIGPLKRLPRSIAIGLLVAGGTLIKPQFAVLFLPPIAMYVYVVRHDRREVVHTLVALAVAAAVPIAATVAYVGLTGSMGAFVDIVTHQIPLYGKLGTDHQVVPDAVRLRYVLENSLSSIDQAMLPAGLIGCALAVALAPRRAALLLSMIVVAAALPMLAAKFWYYHYLPFAFFALLGTGLCFASPARSTGRVPSLAGLIAGAVVALRLTVQTAYNLPAVEPDVHGRAQVRLADAIASYLRQHAQPGDKVQPLDWTEGALHAMLQARLPLATRYMADFQLYHFVDDPYVVNLRRTFLEELRASNARWVVAVRNDYKAWPFGPPGAPHFRELEDFLAHDYEAVAGNDQYLILERRAGRIEN